MPFAAANCWPRIIANFIIIINCAAAAIRLLPRLFRLALLYFALPFFYCRRPAAAALPHCICRAAICAGFRPGLPPPLPAGRPVLFSARRIAAAIAAAAYSAPDFPGLTFRHRASFLFWEKKKKRRGGVEVSRPGICRHGPGRAALPVRRRAPPATCRQPGIIARFPQVIASFATAASRAGLRWHDSGSGPAVLPFIIAAFHHFTPFQSLVRINGRQAITGPGCRRARTRAAAPGDSRSAWPFRHHRHRHRHRASISRRSALPGHNGPQALPDQAALAHSGR